MMLTFWLATVGSEALAGDGRITLLITNAAEVARKEKGAALVTVADVFMDINKKTQRVIATRLQENLAAQGVVAAVEPATIQFPSPEYSAFYLWDGAELVPVALALGEYRVLTVDIQNAEQVVAAQVGSTAVGLASMFGLDLKAEVNKRAAPILLKELHGQGVTAIAAF